MLPPRTEAGPARAPRAPGAVLVIFGAGGDLTKRLLVPALYNLAKAKLLHPDFKVLGVDHAAGDDAAFRSQLEQFLETVASSRNSEFGAGEIVTTRQGLRDDGIAARKYRIIEF